MRYDASVPGDAGSERDLLRLLRDAVSTVRLREEAVRRLASDERAFLPAVAAPIASGILLAAGHVATLPFTSNAPLLLGPAVPATPPDPWGEAIGAFLSYPPLLLLSVAAATVALWGLARLLGGRASFAEQFQPTALATVVLWPACLPVVGALWQALAVPWLLVAALGVMRTVHGLPASRMAIVLLLLLLALASLVDVKVVQTPLQPDLLRGIAR